MRNWINLITEFQLKDVEQMLTTGGGSEPPKPPEDGDDPWDDDNGGGGDGEPPKEPLYNNQIDFSQLADFTRSYIECMLWTEEESIADNGWNSYFSSIHVSAVSKAINDCHKFQLQTRELLEDAFDHGYSEEQAGHDFWLTRNGHGAGYWDRDEIPKELGDKLTAACEDFPEVSAYAGDEDGAVYFS